MSAVATKRRFRAAEWLRCWSANGNEVELMPDGKLWVGYAQDSHAGGGWPVRDRLDLQLKREGGVPAIKALMARAGVIRMSAVQ